ncbi:Map microtubule affinity-regulating kinase [Terramyces sp. JEL0728]|nr:Map microtubule affinity-regulating kinase [Terramyces sp. JEL0728]
MKQIKLKDYSFGKVIGEGSFSKVRIGQYLPTKQSVSVANLQVAIKIVDKEKMREMEMDREQLKKEIDNERVLQGKGGDIAKENIQVRDDAKPIPDKHTQDDYNAKFQEEVLLLMRFDHPNIIKTYKIIDSEEEAYIIMEYASGGELMDYVVSKKHLEEVEARKLFRQLVSAVDYCHESKVVHRDLKLENILLNEAGSVLVSDFGLGRTFNPGERLKTFCGTPTHAAPEMVTGQKYNGAKIDIWAMGVILYVMVTGILPFQGSSIKELFTNISKANYATPYYLSSDLKELLSLIFVANPNKRISIEGIRNHHWVNLDYSSPPKKYALKQFTNLDIGSAITSVNNEGEFTIYNINKFESGKFEKAVETFGQLQKKNNLSASSASMRSRKSITPSDSQRRLNSKDKSLDSSTSAISSDPLKVGKEEGAKPSSLLSLNQNQSLARSKTISYFSGGRNQKKSPLSNTQAISVEDPLKLAPVTIEISGTQNELSGSQNSTNRDIFTKKAKSANVSPRSRSSMENSIHCDISREESILERLTIVGPSDATKSQANVQLLADDPIEFKEIEQWHMIHLPAKNVRTMRFSLKRGLHSTLGPVLMFQDLHKALVKLKNNPDVKLEFKRVPDFYMFMVSIIGNTPEDSMRLEIEICKVWLLNIHALKIKKLSGTAQSLKRFTNTLITLLNWA